MWRPLAGARRVVLLIVDALGANLAAQQQPLLDELFKKAAVTGQLTSIFPSTTVAALSTLWTGAAPAGHGMLGLRLLLPDYAVLGQMLRFAPAVASSPPGALIEAGLEPESFLYAPAFALQLAASGVATYSFKGREIINSPLSKMHDRGVSGNYGALTVADMFVQMRALLEEKVGESLYLCAYWPTIDTLSHAYGWTHPSVSAELRAVLTQLQVELLNSLSARARQDTVLLLLADHGQVVSPPQQHIYLEDHPRLRQMLFMRPAGEPRTAYLYLRHGHQTAALAYIRENLSHAMVAVPAKEALSAGLFGPGPFAPVTEERVGDVVVLMRQGYLLLSADEREKAHLMLGRHGGMTRAEMVVPWLGIRLDSW